MFLIFFNNFFFKAIAILIINVLFFFNAEKRVPTKHGTKIK